MVYLQSFGEAYGLMPEKYAAVFLDNHDTQRNGRAQLTYKNGDLYTFANLFMLAHPYGNARIMSSYYFSNTDQGPPSVGVEKGKYCMDNVNWVCEHRWGPIGRMVKWRNTAGSSAISNWQNGNNGNQIAFSRGGVSFIAFNRGSSDWSTTLYTSLPAGVYCNVYYEDDASTCTKTVSVNSSGKASITVGGLKTVAIHTGCKK
jgi:alpha-amylase